MARTGEKCFQLPNKLDTPPSEVLPIPCVALPVPETTVPVEVLVPVVPEELDVLRAFVLVVLRVFSIVRVAPESITHTHPGRRAISEIHGGTDVFRILFRNIHDLGIDHHL